MIETLPSEEAHASMGTSYSKGSQAIAFTMHTQRRLVLSLDKGHVSIKVVGLGLTG